MAERQTRRWWMAQFYPLALLFSASCLAISISSGQPLSLSLSLYFAYDRRQYEKHLYSTWRQFQLYCAIKRNTFLWAKSPSRKCSNGWPGNKRSWPSLSRVAARSTINLVLVVVLERWMVFHWTVWAKLVGWLDHRWTLNTKLSCSILTV